MKNVQSGHYSKSLIHKANLYLYIQISSATPELLTPGCDQIFLKKGRNY